ncbi:uncharacterized protein LOC118201476 [Stegodyphus dumicola]|uniref:uncharacterized protein LOC118201476 n=1 Tax=Stegodyphus dumicola TaxID=202533 RepID=UPI0015AEF13D|nr:uncharacterized protein LOC118201476 [Stegodyphus dumicola]
MVLSSFKGLKGVQINLHHARAAVSQLQQRYNEQNYSFALIQEPYHVYNKIKGFSSLHRVYYSDKEVPLAGIVIFDNAISVVEVFTSNCLVILKVNFGNNDLLLISAYCSPNADLAKFLGELSMILDKNMTKDILIGADFNAKSDVWGIQEEDSRGKLILEFVNTYGLHILNSSDSIPTFEGSRGSSWIDLTLTNSAYNIDWKVVSDISCSDHNYIEIDINETRSSSRIKKRYNLNKLNWIDFKKDLMFLL